MQDLKILNIVQGFEILFLENSVQGKPPNPPLLNQKQSKLVKEELKEMLLKGAIQPVSPFKNQYLSNLFLVSKRDGNRPIINLKHLNNSIPYQRFKMEGLNFLQNMLQKKNYICKLNQKRRLFLVFSKKRNKEICTVSLGSDTLRVPLSLFWSKSSYSNIYQNLNLPISLLRRLQIHLIIYSSSPTNIIFRLGDSVEMKTICSLKKCGRDCSNVSKCKERQLDPKGFDKVTGEIDLHNSSNFIS